MAEGVERADISSHQEGAGKSRACNARSVGHGPNDVKARGPFRDPVHLAEGAIPSSLDEECESLLRSGRLPDTAALAARYRVSRRTAQCHVKAAMKRLGGRCLGGAGSVGVDVSRQDSSPAAGYCTSGSADRADRATDRVWRAVVYMYRVWVCGGASREDLIALGLRTGRERGRDLSLRTIERDLKWLVQEGILEELGEDSTQSRYRLGPRVASDPGLSGEELARLLGYLELRMQTSPHRTFLGSAYARIDWSLALRRDRSAHDKLASMMEAQSKYCIVQGRLPQVDAREAGLLRDVETAIQEGRRLSLVYEPRRRRGESAARPDPRGGREPGLDADAGWSETVSPLGVIYYWVLDAWYLVSEADPGGTWMRRAFQSCGEGLHKRLQLWRLDRIRSLSLTDVPFAYPHDFDLHELFADRWGLQGGDRMHVRVRFYNDFNVVNRVRAETAHRRNRVLREDPDGNLIYEDDVVGFDDLRTWLRGFGASAEVLEPESLRAAMRESALKMIERYDAPDVGRSVMGETGASG